MGKWKLQEAKACLSEVQQYKAIPAVMGQLWDIWDKSSLEKGS